MKDWWWIPGDLNIADIITRGGTPENPKEESTWQEGPGFLKWPVEEWPIKSACEVAAQAREDINKLQRKAFSAVVSRAQAKRGCIGEARQTPQDSLKSENLRGKITAGTSLLEGRKPAVWAVKNLE